MEQENRGGIMPLCSSDGERYDRDQMPQDCDTHLKHEVLPQFAVAPCSQGAIAKAVPAAAAIVNQIKSNFSRLLIIPSKLGLLAIIFPNSGKGSNSESSKWRSN